MTTQDKADLIQLINYYEAKADENKRSSRTQDVQYIAGYMSGSAQARRQAAADLRKFIEVGEVE